MKKSYVSPDAEYLKIELVEDVLGASQPTEPDTIGKVDDDLDNLDGINSNAVSAFFQ